MLKLPTHEKGKPWSIRVVRSLDGGKTWGKCDAEAREIIVSKATQKKGFARETLIHELLHRYMWFLDEDVVTHVAEEIDFALDAAESAGILEL